MADDALNEGSLRLFKFNILRSPELRLNTDERIVVDLATDFQTDLSLEDLMAMDLSPTADDDLERSLTVREIDGYIKSKADDPKLSALIQLLLGDERLKNAAVGRLDGERVTDALRTVKAIYAASLQAVIKDHVAIDESLALAGRLLRILNLVSIVVHRDDSIGRRGSRWFLQSVPIALVNYPDDAPSSRLARPPAIGDLKVVRMGKPTYTTGAIAHIENVMATETRERTVELSETTERTTERETERISEKVRDLATEQQTLLQSEAAKALSDSFSAQVGLQISASYGPTVSANLNTNVSYSANRSESSRLASSFASTITQRTSERVSERILERSTFRTLVQSKDFNRHSFENSSSEHIVGVYRWVTVSYPCWVENYGQRLMLEFLVPEPGALLKWARNEKQPANDEGKAPDKPRFGPKSITRDNWQDYCYEWQLSDAKPPPPATSDLGFSTTLKEEKNGAYWLADSSLKVPRGYRAVSWVAHVLTWGAAGKQSTVMASVGAGDAVEENPGGDDLKKILRGEISIDEDAMVPIVMQARGYLGGSVAVRVRCGLTAAGFASWQQDIYDLVLVSYEKKSEEWQVEHARNEAKRAAEATRAAEAAQGRNPDANRLLERTELSRSVVEMLVGAPINQVLSGDAVVESTASPPDRPKIDLDIAAKEAPLESFLQQGLEWGNMTWALYPYWWGSLDEWTAAIHDESSDPLHDSFMAAGSARVIVPVRPGFEGSVNFFLATGVPWFGGSAPTLGSPDYLAISDEISELMGRRPPVISREALDPIEYPTSLIILSDGIDKLNDV